MTVMLKKRVLLGLFAVCICLLSACKSAMPSNCFGYREQNFCAEVRGELNGIAFCARISSAEEGTGRKIAVEYLPTGSKNASKSLANLQVTAYADKEGACVLLKGAELKYRDLALSAEPVLVQGLLSPISALLCASSVAAVQRVEEGYRLTLENAAELTLDDSGNVQAYSSKNLYFFVVWWERIP